MTVNGEEKELAEALTIEKLLADMGLDGPVAVERNSQVVPRADHGNVRLEAEDVIEIVHFVGGG